MTREEAIDFNKNLRMYMRLADKNHPYKFPEKNYIALDMAIKALEQEPCEDCISRQAVLDILKDKWNMFSDANDAMQESIDTIESLRPVIPQQKMGRWEEIKSLWGGKWEMIDNYKCSVCGESDVSGNDYKYCPNCGAKMQEGGENA